MQEGMNVRYLDLYLARKYESKDTHLFLARKYESRDTHLYIARRYESKVYKPLILHESNKSYLCHM